MREMRLKDKPSLDITLNETAANTLESQARRGVLAANLKEWLLGTLGHIMNLIKSHLMEVNLGKSMINKGCNRWSEHMFRVVGIHRQGIRVGGRCTYIWFTL